MGRTVKISCEFNMKKLFSQNEFDQFRNANFIYELFLVDYNGDLIDIPVLITNLKYT